MNERNNTRENQRALHGIGGYTMESYYILIASVWLYILAYLRRNNGGRKIKLFPFWDRTLFPFSGEGEAVPVSIIGAAYIEVSLPLSYLMIFIFDIPAECAFLIWCRLTIGILCIAGGPGVLYETSGLYSLDSRLEKILRYPVAAGMVAGGIYILYYGI